MPFFCTEVNFRIPAMCKTQYRFNYVAVDLSIHSSTVESLPMQVSPNVSYTCINTSHFYIINQHQSLSSYIKAFRQHCDSRMYCSAMMTMATARRTVIMTRTAPSAVTAGVWSVHFGQEPVVWGSMQMTNMKAFDLQYGKWGTRKQGTIHQLLYVCTATPTV